MSVLGFEDYYCYDEANNNRSSYLHIPLTKEVFSTKSRCY